MASAIVPSSWLSANTFAVNTCFTRFLLLFFSFILPFPVFWHVSRVAFFPPLVQVIHQNVRLVRENIAITFRNANANAVLASAENVQVFSLYFIMGISQNLTFRQLSPFFLQVLPLLPLLLRLLVHFTQKFWNSRDSASFQRDKSSAY